MFTSIWWVLQHFVVVAGLVGGCGVETVVDQFVVVNADTSGCMWEGWDWAVRDEGSVGAVQMDFCGTEFCEWSGEHCVVDGVWTTVWRCADPAVGEIVYVVWK